MPTCMHKPSRFSYSIINSNKREFCSTRTCQKCHIHKQLSNCLPLSVAWIKCRPLSPSVVVIIQTIALVCHCTTEWCTVFLSRERRERNVKDKLQRWKRIYEKGGIARKHKHNKVHCHRLTAFFFGVGRGGWTPSARYLPSSPDIIYSLGYKERKQGV